MRNKKITMSIDIAMTVLLPMLMAYSLIGEQFHEIIGTAVFVLFVLHHIANRAWHRSLFRGRYTLRRAVQTALNLLLLVFLIAQPVSGILLSKHLYTWIQPAGISANARGIHLLLAYWGFVLMCIHAGTHLLTPAAKLQRKAKHIRLPVTAAWGILSLYGCYAFGKRQLADYLFRRSAFVFFDFSEPRLYFFLDYIAVMMLFALLGMFLAAGLNRMHAQKRTRREDRIK